MKNSLLALKLRTRLQETSMAKNICEYCRSLKMQKKCSAYRKSREKPFCCKLKNDKVYDFYELVMFRHNQPNNQLLGTGTSFGFQSEMRLNDIFFTYLFLFPFILLILLNILTFLKRGYLMVTKFLFTQ